MEGGGGGHGKVGSSECDLQPKLTPANCLWSASETGQTASFGIVRRAPHKKKKQRPSGVFPEDSFSFVMNSQFPL